MPGSHKSNFRAPGQLIHGGDSCSQTEGGEEGTDSLKDVCVQPEVKPGDVILFSEGTVHGASPWRNEWERRVALYRFAPSFMGYGKAYSMGEGISKEEQTGFWPSELTEGMTPGQKAVCQPPFATHLERATVDGEGGANMKERSKAKKDFDMKVFGRECY